MSPVAVVTDSTAYIPPEKSEGLPIFVTPLHVIWNGVSYRDNEDIKPAEFYRRLETENTHPQSSQVSPNEFINLYSQLIEQGYEIISIHLSSKLTSTLDSAIQAKEYLKHAKIELVDSLTASMATGWQVLVTARAALSGASLGDCLHIAEKAVKNSAIFFVPASLEFLHRGGRIGGASAFLGSMLQILPILSPVEGRVEALEKVRTFNKAIDRMVEILAERVAGLSPVHIAAVHSNYSEKGEEILEKARQVIGVDSIMEDLITDISPVIGVHIGPGAVGLAYLAGL